MSSQQKPTSGDSVISYSLILNGQPLSDLFQVLQVEVNHAVNKISSAEISIVAGDVTDGLLNVAPMDPGDCLEISIGYNGVNTPVFTGLVVKQSLDIDAGMGWRYRFYCKQDAIQTTFTPHYASFENKSDADIIRELIAGYVGIACDVADTNPVHPIVVQHNLSDWDLIISRATRNGLLVIAKDRSLLVHPPRFDSSPVLKLVFGENILSFSGTLSAMDQPTGISYAAWDPATQALIQAEATEPSFPKTFGSIGKTYSKKLDQSKANVKTDVAIDATSLVTLASAQLLRKRMSAVQCEVQFHGTADATVGSIVSLENLGNFGGLVFVSAVKHDLRDGYWSTTINTGLPETSPFEEPAPTTSGIQLGIVQKLEGDPENGGRILVSLAIDFVQCVWARMASFYATNSHGFSFYPEIGDEVVLGMIDNDPSALVILGSLYSKKNPAGNVAKDNNCIKSITTKSGVSIEIDDEHKTIEIKTPGNNYVRLDDEKKEILLSDQNNNKIQLNDTGICIESPKDLQIKAANINMNAVGNIKLTSSSDTSIQAMNIKQHAEVGVEIKGNASAELSASGQTTVKGSIVMIN